MLNRKSSLDIEENTSFPFDSMNMYQNQNMLNDNLNNN